MSILNLFKKKIWKVIGRTGTKGFEMKNCWGDQCVIHCHLLFLENQFGGRKIELEIDYIDSGSSIDSIYSWRIIDYCMNVNIQKELIGGVSIEKFGAKYGINLVSYENAQWEYKEYQKSFDPKLGHTL